MSLTEAQTWIGLLARRLTNMLGKYITGCSPTRQAVPGVSGGEVLCPQIWGR